MKGKNYLHNNKLTISIIPRLTFKTNSCRPRCGLNHSAW